MANSINILKPSVCFEVLKVIGITSKGNCKSYQVQWAPSWVSGVNLIGCEDLIEQFVEEEKEKEHNIKCEVLDLNESQDGADLFIDMRVSDDINLPDEPISELNTGIIMENSRRILGETFVLGRPEPVVTYFDKGINAAMSLDNTFNLDSPDTTYNNENHVEEVKMFDIPANKTEPTLSCGYGVDKKIAETKMKSKQMFGCNICSKTFSNSGSLRNHSKIHSATKDIYQCSTCNRKFSTKIILQKHELGHDDKRSCHICQEKFIDNIKLRVHIRSHTKERPYKCVLCPKMFLTSTDLKRHTRVHTGERPFDCKFCQKKFKINDHLQKHLKTHAQERPSMCNNV